MRYRKGEPPRCADHLEMILMATILTATELAGMLDTDSRTARKFLRSITPKDAQPGKGSRWGIEKAKVRGMRSKFVKFTADENAKREARELAKNATAESAENEIDENDENDDPTESDLAEIDDEN